MDRIPIPKLKDPDMEQILNKTFDNAMGVFINNLSRVPTSSNDDLKPNQWGPYDGKLYINIDGTTYYLPITEST